VTRRAARHELEHRVEGQDSRRMWFAMWQELTAALDPEWGGQVAREVAATLRRAVPRRVSPVGPAPLRVSAVSTCLGP